MMSKNREEGMKIMKWKCGKCGYVYDEEKQGTPFEQLPDDWKCPRCRSPKSRYKKMTEAPKKT